MKRPNIVIIICDQLSAQALPAWGNGFARTPNIDTLVASGTRCASAYTNCPLCLPSRASFWTSRYPHQTGVISNGIACQNAEVGEETPTLGSLLQSAGYATAHFGKQHDGGALRGFNCEPPREVETEPTHPSLRHNYDTRQDRYARECAVDFLTSYQDEAPYCMVADFNNPHNICGWIGDHANDRPLNEVFDELPPLPENLHLSDEELASRPLPIQHLPNAHRRQAQVAGWDENKFRHYLHAYHYYLSLVDAEIGHVLNALRQRDDAHDTLIVFFSDHGDSMAGRWMATKHTSFYEETMHVPLAFSGAGILGQGKVMRGLCSLLDVLPTLCDFAGVAIPESAQGCSLYSDLVEDNSHMSGQDAVFAQWHTEWGYTVEPGRMVRTEGYKYTHYLEADEEELYDLHADPGEMHNLAHAPERVGALKEHRALLEDYLRRTSDPYRSLKPVVDPMFRTRPVSYRHFSGPVAPDVFESREAMT